MTTTALHFVVEGAQGDVLPGELRRPLAPPQGLVLFVHGSGSSRQSPRNRLVASVLANVGLATLLFDLLTAEEARVDEATAALRFDIPLLSSRVVAVLDQVRARPDVGHLPVGLFGASTGAAAALVAAAERPDVVRAVVSRGGRVDLAGDALPRVRCPTLLIVGELDDVVVTLNEEAQTHLRTEARLELIRGATHLFEEPGALEQVAEAAARWFMEHLSAGHGLEMPPQLA